MAELIFAMFILLAVGFIFGHRIIISCIVSVIVGAIILGYGLNIISFINCDFKEPYREEAIRGVGVVFPPVGVIAGYMEIEDK